MTLIQLLFFCGLLGLGSSWNCPGEVNSCHVRKAACSSGSEYKEDIKGIKESLQDISTTLKVIAQNQETAVTETPPTDPVSDVTTTNEPPTTTEPPPPIGSFDNPASSCSDISQDSPSGEYWIQNNNNSPLQVYCDMTRTCSCNTATGGWTRVANFDMTDINQQCPDGFRVVTRTTAPLRTCGRPGSVGCVSTTYPVHGIEYSHVCGRIVGYQDGTPDAFFASQSIDGYYVDGVSITHGQSPRQHIWTFAAALGEEVHSTEFLCPCSIPGITDGISIPSFVGNDYFCETGERGSILSIFHADDPLWNGQGCGGTSTCCAFNNPPWFCKRLPQPTTDDIELRVCGDQVISDEDTPIEVVEMYIM